MTRRPAALLMLLTLWAFAKAQADTQWHGYINDKTFTAQAYGYLYTQSIPNSSSKLRLICKVPDKFILLLPSHGTSVVSADEISVSVDSLPALKLTTGKLGNNTVVTNESHEFWRLLAQMVAGARLNIVWPGQSRTTSFHLHGFTKAYNDHCGWLDASDRYDQYIKYYR